MQEKSLVLVAHGSRRASSNDEVRALAARLSDKERHNYSSVTAAFLELAEPSIPDGIRKAINNGAKEVVVLPYFLSAGRHVVEDIPAEVDIVRAERPDIDIHIAPYLGGADHIVEVLSGLATSAMGT